MMEMRESPGQRGLAKSIAAREALLPRFEHMAEVCGTYSGISVTTLGIVIALAHDLRPVAVGLTMATGLSLLVAMTAAAAALWPRVGKHQTIFHPIAGGRGMTPSKIAAEAERVAGNNVESVEKATDYA